MWALTPPGRMGPRPRGAGAESRGPWPSAPGEELGRGRAIQAACTLGCWREQQSGGLSASHAGAHRTQLDINLECPSHLPPPSTSWRGDHRTTVAGWVATPRTGPGHLGGHLAPPPPPALHMSVVPPLHAQSPVPGEGAPPGAGREGGAGTPTLAQARVPGRGDRDAECARCQAGTAAR